MTRIKIVPAAADDVSLTPDERTRGPELAQKLGMRSLSRAWQILFKGYDEVAKAGNAVQAAEMVLIRLAYAADLPSPDELIERLSSQSSVPAAPVAAPPATAPRGNGGGTSALRQSLPQAVPNLTPRPDLAPAAAPRSDPLALANPRDYAELVALAGERREVLLKHLLESSLRPVSFAEGRIEVALAPGTDMGIIQTLSAKLKLSPAR